MSRPAIDGIAVFIVSTPAPTLKRTPRSKGRRIWKRWVARDYNWTRYESPVPDGRVLRSSEGLHMTYQTYVELQSRGRAGVVSPARPDTIPAGP